MPLDGGHIVRNVCQKLRIFLLFHLQFSIASIVPWKHDELYVSKLNDRTFGNAPELDDYLDTE